MRERARVEGVEVLLMSSITEVQPQDKGLVVVAGSHAGANIAQYALRYPLQAAFFNDAGNGKDDAGTIGLVTFAENGLPAATVSHLSARIGDARDALENGVISYANEPARKLGFGEGERLRDAIARCLAADRRSFE